MSALVPQDFQHFVREEVASGKYRSEEEVIAAALQLLKERERKRDGLLLDLQAGIDQLDNGKGIPIANEKAHQEFFQDIENRGQERLAAKRTQA